MVPVLDSMGGLVCFRLVDGFEGDGPPAVFEEDGVRTHGNGRRISGEPTRLAGDGGKRNGSAGDIRGEPTPLAGYVGLAGVAGDGGKRNGSAGDIRGKPTPLAGYVGLAGMAGDGGKRNGSAGDIRGEPTPLAGYVGLAGMAGENDGKRAGSNGDGDGNGGRTVGDSRLISREPPRTSGGAGLAGMAGENDGKRASSNANGNGGRTAVGGGMARENAGKRADGDGDGNGGRMVGDSRLISGERPRMAGGAGLAPMAGENDGKRDSSNRTAGDDDDSVGGDSIMDVDLVSLDYDSDDSDDSDCVIWGDDKEYGNPALLADKPLLVGDVLAGHHVSLDGELLVDGPDVSTELGKYLACEFKRRYLTRSQNTNIQPSAETRHKSVYDRFPDDPVISENGYDDLHRTFASHPTLQRNDVYNMVFIIEEPTEKYLEANKSSQLTQLGRYHKHRIKLAKTIHVVFPAQSQFYLLKHAKGAHHQDQWSNFACQILVLKKYRVPIRIYSPSRSHTGEFLTLLNGPDAEFAFFIRWDALRNLRLAKLATAKQAGDQRHRSGTSRDYGFCRSQNSSAQGSSTGIPAPRMKADSTDPAVQEAMVLVTEAALRIDSSIFDGLDPRAFEEFSFKIHPKNRLTSARESETKPGSCCGIHDDQSTNSRVMTAVFGASVIRNGVRQSFNAQHKHSVDAYCHRVAGSHDLMTHIQEFVQQCDPRRIGVSQSLFEGEPEEFIRGVPCIVNQANLDPKSFGQTNLDSVLRLCLEFSLSLPEIISLLLGMEMVPNQTYLSRVATLIMIQSPASEKRQFPRGPLFGRLFALILRQVATTYMGRKTFRRYNHYDPRDVPDRDT